MCTKNTSGIQKHHYQAFYLAQRDPERWEHERNITLSENLDEAWERAGTEEREAMVNKKLVMNCQRWVSLVITCEDELPLHTVDTSIN